MIAKKLYSQRFHALWIISSATICILSIIVLLSDGWDHQWINSAILWFSLSTVGPAFIALMLSIVSKLCRLGAEISDAPPVITVHPIRIMISSIAGLGLALSTTLSVEVFPFEIWANKLAFLIACTFFLSYGALTYIYISMLLFIARLGKVRVTGGMFSWPLESIRAIHDIYIYLLLIGSTTYFIGVGVIRLTPWATSWHSLNQPWIHLWVLPPALALIFYFFTVSLSLHRLLLQCRDRSEYEINEQLQIIYDLWKKNIEPKLENSISTLLTWRNNIRSEKTWTIDFKTVIVTIATLLLPTIEAVVKLVKLGSN